MNCQVGYHDNISCQGSGCFIVTGGDWRVRFKLVLRVRRCSFRCKGTLFSLATAALSGFVHISGYLEPQSRGLVFRV